MSVNHDGAGAVFDGRGSEGLVSNGNGRDGSAPGKSPMPAADLLAVGMIVAGADGAASFANRTWGVMTGQADGSWSGQGWFEAIVEPDRVAGRADLLSVVGTGETFRADWRVRRADLATRVLHITAAPQLEGGRVTGLVATMTDVTDARASAERLFDQATHDALTGLYNRAQFLDFVGQALDRQVRDPERLSAVLSVDIGGLREANDRLGHGAGDRLLRSSAAWITAAVRSTDVVARYGGNEFAVLCEGLTDAAAIQLIAERIRGASPDDGEEPVNLRVGSALVDDPRRTPSAVVDRADRDRGRAGFAPGGRSSGHPSGRPPGSAPQGRTADVESVLAAAAHELLNPLTAISGFSTMLRDNRDRMAESDLDTAFAVLERQCSGLITLLDDLLELGSRHNAVGRPEMAQVPLDAAVADALRIAPPPDGRTVTTPASGSAPSVFAEPRSLARVVVNLLTNAYRYGGSNITVTWGQEDGETVLGVEDDGTGVPEEILATLFRPFTRGRNPGSGATAGRGLGLALARETVQSVGGRLDYRTRPPNGARFVATFPVDRGRRTP